MGGFGTSKQKSRLQTQTLPGLFGGTSYEPGARIGSRVESILNQEQPSWSTYNADEERLLGDIASRTHGASALRGLDSATPGSLAQMLAPQMINLQSRKFDEGMAKREQTIKGLLELAGYAMPQVIGGQKSSGSSFNVNATL
mgnify:CR=1 FL=1